GVVHSVKAGRGKTKGGARKCLWRHLLRRAFATKFSSLPVERHGTDEGDARSLVSSWNRDEEKTVNVLHIDDRTVRVGAYRACSWHASLIVPRGENELPARNGDQNGTHVSLDRSACESHILLRELSENGRSFLHTCSAGGNPCG